MILLSKGTRKPTRSSFSSAFGVRFIILKYTFTTIIFICLTGCSLNYGKSNSSYFGGDIDSHSQAYSHYGYSDREIELNTYEVFYVLPMKVDDKLAELIAKRASELCRRVDSISFDDMDSHGDIGADMPNTYWVSTQRAVVKCK